MKTFWNWDIHYACNYRCPYCFLAGKWDAAAEANRYPGINKWIEAWNKIYSKYGECHIHLSGGEPSAYPEFFELVGFLAKKSTIELSTNLSFNAGEFIEKCGSSEVRINASFHPEFASLVRFSEDISLLKENKFSVSVSFVAYPPQLGMLAGLKTHFAEREIRFVVQPFRGEYDGRKYPAGYTEDEKDLLRNCGEDILSSKDMVAYHLEEKQKSKKFCHMGQWYGKIYASADVHRCCSTGAPKIGNLLVDSDFSLLTKPELCEVEECVCWRRMVIGEEDKWASHWR